MPTDYGWKMPDAVWELLEDRRSRLARLTPDLCEFEGGFFIRAVLELPFSEQPGHFAWDPWVELPEQHYRRYVELYHEDASDEPMVPGVLANEIPAYPSTLGLPVLVRFRDRSSRPGVHVAETSHHALAAEQSRGIGNQRYHELLAATGLADAP